VRPFSTPCLVLWSALVLALLALPRAASAETWQAPVGGRVLTMPAGQLACGSAGGWVVENNGAGLVPPKDEAAVGHAVEVTTAASASACATSTERLTLIATGKWPQVDAPMTSLFVDEARLEVRGRGLVGLGVRWRATGQTGSDVCLRPEADPERCSFGVGRGLPVDPAAVRFTFIPAGGREDAVTFDANGRRTTDADLALPIARVVLSRVAPEGATVDLATRPAGRIALVHPAAVVSAECGAGNCETADGAIVVHDVTTLAATVQVHLRLLPHVFVQHGDTFDASPTVSVSVLPCAMSIASGPPLREVDDGKVVVRLDARCANDAASLHFNANGRPANTLRIVSDGGSTFVLVRVGRLEDEDLVVTASHGSLEGSIVGQARAATHDAPVPRASLEITGHAAVDVIPTNREALVRFADPPGGNLVLLPLPGVYDVTDASGGGAMIRGTKGSGGIASLRFGYRVPSLPAALARENLAVVTEPTQRVLREVSVPVPLGDSSIGSHPFVELVCGAVGHEQRVVPGSKARVPYVDRDACRLLLHRERLSPEDGAQALHLELDVTRVDGTPRPEAHVSQSIILRAAPEPRIAWIHGVTAQFDRVTVRITHNVDESRDTEDLAKVSPSVQWAFSVGSGHARIYATTAIPTGLYRVSDRDHSGILALNLGVLARFTWLDQEGSDGFLGLETGVVGVGLANDQSSTGHSLTQVSTVFGAGLSVPIANRSLATETSINLHAWFEYEVSRDVGNEPGSPFGFVFGPSISIGNIGTNL
jgi:hypothetical protein